MFRWGYGRVSVSMLVFTQAKLGYSLSNWSILKPIKMSLAIFGFHVTGELVQRKFAIKRILHFFSCLLALVEKHRITDLLQSNNRPYGPNIFTWHGRSIQSTRGWYGYEIIGWWQFFVPLCPVHTSWLMFIGWVVQATYWSFADFWSNLLILCWLNQDLLICLCLMFSITGHGLDYVENRHVQFAGCVVCIYDLLYSDYWQYRVFFHVCCSFMSVVPGTYVIICVKSSFSMAINT